jgi:hypothetical protein
LKSAVQLNNLCGYAVKNSWQVKEGNDIRTRSDMRE